jgi:glucose/arabinose dehydrogenase
MRRTRRLLALAFVVVLALWTAAREPAPARAAGIQLHLLTSGLSSPVGIVSAHDGTGRLFIIEQTGTVRIWTGSALLPTPFLDVSSMITQPAGSEQGLLGLAFHPSYETNGRFFIQYTDTTGDLVVARYTVSGDPNVANPSGTTILTQAHPSFTNHNGGQLQFGPDGYLYIGFGDGGGGGDPSGNGQNVNTLLGKLLRIDVDAGPTYAAPADNPLVGLPGRDEILAYGLRNPWRFSFDRDTGDLFVADVGQDIYEEVDLQPAGTTALRNYGWNVMEATHCYAPATGCDTSGKVLPILEYDHSLGCAVVGGYRYRGGDPTLVGRYIYGDFCSGRIWAASQSGSTWTSTVVLDTPLLISSFGEDDAGELYLASYGDGALYRITQAPPHAVGGIAQLPGVAAARRDDATFRLLAASTALAGAAALSAMLAMRRRRAR